MLKTILLCGALLLMPLGSVWADYKSSFVMIEKKDISKLSDDDLTNAYMDALVEVQARKDFFNRFGFKDKELDDYRHVLKYRLVLLMEIHGRNLDIPQFDRY